MMTEEQAIAFYESGAWQRMDDYQISVFQLSEERMCIPFRIFHKAVGVTLGRPVLVHELAHSADLLAEIIGTHEAPTLQTVIDMIPEEKRVILDLTLPNRDN